MLKITLYMVTALLCLNFTAKAQSQPSQIKPLKIGDTIPEVVWNMPLQVVNHPQGKKTITLNDYKGKLIILDFWATWCVPCIKSFPEFNDLQRKYNQDIQFVLTSTETKEALLNFFKENKMQMPSAYGQKILQSYFPHNAIPHEIWIKENKVIAITHANYVTEANVLKALNNNSIALPQKKMI